MIESAISRDVSVFALETDGPASQALRKTGAHRAAPINKVFVKVEFLNMLSPSF